MNANGIGSIQPRMSQRNGKKVYDVQYRVTDPVTGQKKQKMKRGFLTKKEAQDFLNNTQNAISTGVYVSPSKLTVADVANEWYKDDVETRVRPTTQAGYRINKNSHIIPSIGDVLVQKLTADQIQSFYNKKYADGLSPASVRYIHKNLRQILNFGIRRKYITINPALDPIIKVKKIPKYKAEVLDQETILDLVINKIPGHPMVIPIILGGLSGLRRGEILGLKWSDLSLEKGTMHINAQRTVADEDETKRSEVKTASSDRTIPIPQFTLDLLKQMKRDQDDLKERYADKYNDLGYVCCRMQSGYGMPFHPNYVSKNFSDVLAKWTLPHIRFHDLRHSYATNLIHMRIPITTVSKLLGHESPDITLKIYAHVFNEMYDADIQEINDSYNETITQLTNKTG
jgi:Site-specific recombinase XerC